MPNPLAQPRERDLLDQFLPAAELRSEGGHREQLAGLCSAFAAVPYENLTKIVKYAECRLPAAARRATAEVIADYQRFHAGGTCFSLTAALLHLVRAWGFQPAPILADRRLRCRHALRLDRVDGRPAASAGSGLPDRGSDSTAFPVARRRRAHALQPARTGPRRRSPRGSVYDLPGQSPLPPDVQDDPVDDRAFLQAWDASFDWEMMHYPVLTRVTEHEQLYLRGTHFQKRTQTTIEREVIPEQQLLVADRAGIRHQPRYRPAGTGRVAPGIAVNAVAARINA